MMFAGVPNWDSAARESTIGFDGALLSAAQNRCGRQFRLVERFHGPAQNAKM
jgi:hypothetical protein